MFGEAEHAYHSGHADNTKSVEGVEMILRHDENAKVGHHRQDVYQSHFTGEKFLTIWCSEGANDEF